MVSISMWLHMKRQFTQLSLKSSAETRSEPRKQLQYSVRVSPRSHSTCDLQQTNLPFGPQVPLYQMRSLKMNDLNSGFKSLHPGL